MKKHLAMFDMDGTLFQTDEVNFLSYRQAMRETGFDLDRATFAGWNGRAYSDFLPGALENDQQQVKAVHDRKKELYRTYLSEAKKNAHLFRMLEQMKDSYHIALVTTASAQNCRDILAHFKVEHLFDLFVTQEDVTRPKPHPEGFLKAMKHFEMGAENCMIFEDSESGLKAANQTGATVFAVHHFPVD